ncbi:DEKNAAC101592 [Brettanomyces naardenensis]|uniref:Pumilio homology domain family member 3 n=1 Tax=Brettanomyces naardenensis TaxID=13370 RepID=A0A448YIG9_BRENA|nr:DEKNAAC101592 [Brettanomyces naardenensis]
MSWNDFKSVSLDDPINSNPWDSHSAGSTFQSRAPNPAAPQFSSTTAGNSRHGSMANQRPPEDVSSIISSLGKANSTLFGKANSVFGAFTSQQPPRPGNPNANNVMNIDEAVISDSGSDLFNPNSLKDALSAISAPVANVANGGGSVAAGYSQSRLASNLFGSGLKTSNFLEKFSSVTEKTRELERSLGKLSLGSQKEQIAAESANSSAAPSNRASFSSPIQQQSFRDPRKSFSEKLDSYISNNNSPAQSRHLSFSSDAANGNAIVSEHNSVSLDGPETQRAAGIWNPAAATSFFPQAAGGPGPLPPGALFSQGMVAPPFVVPSPNYLQMPLSPFMPPLPMYDTNAPTQMEPPNPNASSTNPATANASGSDDSSSSPPRNAFFRPGLARPMSPYIAPPFSPYGIPIQPVGPSPPVQSADMAKAPSPPIAVFPESSSPKPGKRGSSGPRSAKPKKHIFRSPLLEEFRSNKSGKHFALKDIFGHGYEFSKDQHGSRFIQQQLVNTSDEDKEVIFNEIRNYSIDLMTDVFGNYVIQKYFEYGNDTQRRILFESMRGNFNFLSLQMYGCRVVQKCMESVPLDDKLEIVEELRPNILNLVKDQNGNHVIQKVIECVPTEKTPFILESLKHQIYHLSTHPYGCRVIQRLLEYSDEEDRAYILGELKGFIYYLVQDQFGNYVIQHVIEHGATEYSEQILQIVIDNLVELSKHKFASNAVEKCIVHQTSQNRDRVYHALLENNETRDGTLDESTALYLMMKDPFANYVVQKMVELVDGDKRELLIFKIRQYLDMIGKTNPTGKHLASIDKLIALTERYD